MTSSDPLPVNRTSIAATYDAIWPDIRTTPVIDIALPNVPAKVCLKLECLQHTGSFKARGAFANLVAAGDAVTHVTAASGGNHGAAVAYAAREMCLEATIFVPEIAAPAKIARIRDYGAEVVVGGARYADTVAACEAFAETTGALNIHAYDAPETMMGQGTLGLEFEQQAPDLDKVLIAVGGGGLIGGVAAWHAGGPAVIGVEPEKCPTLFEALKAGAPVEVRPDGIAADSLGASRIGDLPFAVAREHVERCVLVSDDDVRAAQAWLWRNLRLVTEPGGAAALAALLCGKLQTRAGQRIGVVSCGANTDPASFAKDIQHYYSGLPLT